MNKHNNKVGYFFTGHDGTFTMENPEMTSYLYFPLANNAGMMSSITPLLGGDIKSDQNTFLMTPVSQEELHNSRGTRNFWVWSESEGPWSVTGNSALQTNRRFDKDRAETVSLEAGFLWHKIIRENRSYGLKAEVTSFVPASADKVELMEVKITNVSNKNVEFTPTAAIPMYGRSADNIRDHRHVTSLLHRIYIHPNGIRVCPALTFDERGHKNNNVNYFVLGSTGSGDKPVDFFPTIEGFIGEGGCLDWPEAVVNNLDNATDKKDVIQGYEAMGGLRFEKKNLFPGESCTYIIVMGICDDKNDIQRFVNDYCSEYNLISHLEQNKNFWREKLDKLLFDTGDENFNQWMHWVALQPILRRIYGCSFLPHHDYGRGGRGWRDLWQDCLALLIMEPDEVRELLLSNFAGVRLDGSNATIIGSQQGEFIADRNNISRVWMDHGAWPFLTIMLYINQTGDLKFLLEQQTYFKDKHILRSKQIDNEWIPNDGNCIKTADYKIYYGTVLEHILFQNVIPFFNVGENNNILLEGADWNDALDMASDKGESVAFSALYANNLSEISDLILKLKSELRVEKVELAKECLILLDSITGLVDYSSVIDKRSLLQKFYSTCGHKLSGEKVWVDCEILAKDLQTKAEWLVNHIRKNEWIEASNGFSWFNGYYDNNGDRVEGDFNSCIKMTLTGQVFTAMGKIATQNQINNIICSVNKYLRDPKIGYRLNSDFKEMQPNLGRAFGFAFGHKENGAMFSHMTVMYANALYKRGFVKEGFEVLDSIYKLCTDFDKSRIYPGIPEYINQKGRGMYQYLTGSASWLLITMLNEVYGVKGSFGDLLLQPKLMRKQFRTDGLATICTIFAGKRFKVTYRNPCMKEYGEYKILNIKIDDNQVNCTNKGDKAVIKQSILFEFEHKATHLVDVELG